MLQPATIVDPLSRSINCVPRDVSMEGWCRLPWDVELTSDTVGDAADCCGTLVDIADTRGKTRGSRGTLADTADVGDIGIRAQEPRHH